MNGLGGVRQSFFSEMKTDMNLYAFISLQRKSLIWILCTQDKGILVIMDLINISYHISAKQCNESKLQI